MRLGRPATRGDPNESPLAALAHRLRSRRLALDLSMDEVARRAGCSASILGEYERGERAPRDEQFVRDLAGVLGLGADELVADWALVRRLPASRSRQDERKAHRVPTLAVAIACGVVVVLVVVAVTSIGGTDVVSPQAAPAPDAHTDVAAHPSIHVTPSSNLADGQMVNVTGGGFEPPSVNVLECGGPAPGGCDFGANPDGHAGGQVFATVASDGTFSLQLYVQATFTGYDLPGGTPLPVSCATSGCIITASQGPDANVSTPISFGSSVPTRNPSITVSKSTGLTDGERVTVRGTGYTPSGARVWVGVCRSPMTLPPVVCDHESAHVVLAPVDDKGRFTKSITLHATFKGRRDDDPTIVPVDCRVAPGCFISGGQANPNKSAFELISFDP